VTVFHPWDKPGCGWECSAASQQDPCNMNEDRKCVPLFSVTLCVNLTSHYSGFMGHTSHGDAVARSGDGPDGMLCCHRAVKLVFIYM
jgi:hypothetical protein